MVDCIWKMMNDVKARRKNKNKPSVEVPENKSFSICDEVLMYTDKVGIPATLQNNFKAVSWTFQDVKKEIPYEKLLH